MPTGKQKRNHLDLTASKPSPISDFAFPLQGVRDLIGQRVTHTGGEQLEGHGATQRWGPRTGLLVDVDFPDFQGRIANTVENDPTTDAVDLRPSAGFDR